MPVFRNRLPLHIDAGVAAVVVDDPPLDSTAVAVVVVVVADVVATVDYTVDTDSTAVVET